MAGANGDSKLTVKFLILSQVGELDFKQWLYYSIVLVTKSFKYVTIEMFLWGFFPNICASKNVFISH